MQPSMNSSLLVEKACRNIGAAACQATCRTHAGEAAVHKHKSRVDIPEVFEGRVDFKAPAVHVSDVGSGQFHFSDSQPSFVILKITNTKIEKIITNRLFTFSQQKYKKELFILFLHYRIDCLSSSVKYGAKATRSIA